MKKILILLLIILFSGCTKQNIIINDVLSITYNDNKIVENDYADIIESISKIDFYCGKQRDDDFNNTITITTNKDIYKFNVSNNYYMEYLNNNNYCYTKNSDKVKELSESLKKTIEKYNDISYFTIRNEKGYTVEQDATFVKLDKGNNYIIVNSIYPLYEFKINQIEIKNEEIKEISLLYSAEVIDKKRNIIIRKEVMKNSDFMITFKNQYGYTVNIVPIINDNNEINFVTEQKK